MRLKGNADGPVYQGADLVEPCVTCGPLKYAPGATKPRPSQEQQYADLHAKMRAMGLEPGKIYFSKPEPPAPPPKPPAQLVLPVPGVDPRPSVEIHTLRFGDAEWLRACVPSLDDWCRRHDLPLTSWSDPGDRYPSPKFVEIEMLQAFLAGAAEWMMYIDADVFMHPSAPVPDFLREPGFYIAEDRPSRGARGFPGWIREHFAAEAGSWRYRNAGVWACDREAAQRLLEAIAPPFIEDRKSVV